MNRVRLILLACLWACSSPSSDGSNQRDKMHIDVAPVIDMTPPESGIESPRLVALDKELENFLRAWLKKQSQLHPCSQQFDLRLQPRVIYGTMEEQTPAKFIAQWSLSLALRHRPSGIVAHLELFEPFEHSTTAPLLDGALRVGLENLKAPTLKALNSLSDDPKTVLASLSASAATISKLVLERISMCSHPRLDALLDFDFLSSDDDDVRLRFVGVVGERQYEPAAAKLIDAVELNEHELTRAIVRTLSILDHPRTRALFEILVLHDSPSLRKEVEAALQRLETRGKMNYYYRRENERK